MRVSAQKQKSVNTFRSNDAFPRHYGPNACVPMTQMCVFTFFTPIWCKNGLPRSPKKMGEIARWERWILYYSVDYNPDQYSSALRNRAQREGACLHRQAPRAAPGWIIRALEHEDDGSTSSSTICCQLFSLGQLYMCNYDFIESSAQVMIISVDVSKSKFQ